MNRVGTVLLLIACSGCARVTAPTYGGSEEVVKSIRSVVNANSESTSDGKTNERPQPTGFATFRGRFQVLGNVVSGAAFSPEKDKEVCGKGGKQIPDESVVVSSDGGLANVLIFVTSDIPVNDEKWCHPDYQASATATIDFDQKECVFLTHVAPIRVGQRFRILNSDTVAHNTKVDGNGDAKTANFTIGAGESVLFDVGGAAQSPYTAGCSIHPWMKAWMFNVPHPYFAVTNRNGEFEIGKVPAGVPLEFRVWHEKANYVEDVSVNGSVQRWPKGKFKLTFKPEEVADFKATINAALFNK